MTTPTRTPGKCGCLAPKNAPAPLFRTIWRQDAVIPPHPATEDYLAALANWQMLGNDRAGDCVAVTWANFRRMMTALLGGREVYPTQDQVWEIYKTQNPDFDPNGTADTNGPGSSADGGMDIQTLLELLVTTGGPDGVKVRAFAKVDFTDEAELDAALAIFGGLWVGILVSPENQQEFADNQPWDAVGQPDGAHSVLVGGYIPDPRFITWAAETSFTELFRQQRVQQAWAVAWPEHEGTKQFQAAIDQGAWDNAWQELTGQPFPVPVPSPAPPVPSPSPSPDPVPPAPNPTPVSDAAVQLVATAGPWANEEHVTPGARKVAQAIRTFRAAVGL